MLFWQYYPKPHVPLRLVSDDQRGRVQWLLGHWWEDQFRERRVQADAPQYGAVPRPWGAQGA